MFSNHKNSVLICGIIEFNLEPYQTYLLYGSHHDTEFRL